ncbi:tetratricopeptide repeat protein [Granulicella arctica]|uniref:tetratricopeptide repeat protein n=1 Tax=Granulicella arctica TaxID=940613 RepID=UPI0021DFC8A7|nr:tetratricopeptide repeat protein [Granulicella arctica]
MAVFLFYGYTITSGFAPYDDPILIVGNPSVHSISASLKYFSNSVSFTSDLRGSEAAFYRPLFWMSLAADANLWGLSPIAFHITNLVLHWGDGILLYFLLHRLKSSQVQSLCITLLWLVLPVNSEAVAWISGRSYLLVTLFILAALLCAARYLAGEPKIFLAGYGLAAAVALLCHEQGVLLLPLTLLVALLFGAARTRRAMELCVIAILVGGGYVLLIKALGDNSGLRFGAISSVGLTLARYIGWLLLPVHMSVERSTDTPITGWSYVAVLTLLVAVAVIITLFFVRKIPKLVRVGLVWILVCMLPFTGIVLIYQGMAERFLYLASIGLAISVVACCASIRGQTRAFVIGVVALWVVWGVGRLEMRLVDWHSPLRLYQSSLRATPRSFKLGYDLGALYEEQGRYNDALEAYRESLRMNIGYEPSIAGMGNAYLLLNDPEIARKFYEQALVRKNDDVKTINNYGTALDRLGRLNDAKRQYLRSIALAPTDDTAYCDLAVLFYDAGDADVAVTLFKKAISVNAHDPLPYSNLAAIYVKQGHKELALPMYREVLELDPGNESAIQAVQSLQRK